MHFFVQLATRDLRRRFLLMAGIQRNRAKLDKSRTNSCKFITNVEAISVYQRTPVKMGPATHVGEMYLRYIYPILSSYCRALMGIVSLKGKKSGVS